MPAVVVSDIYRPKTSFKNRGVMGNLRHGAQPPWGKTIGEAPYLNFKTESSLPDSDSLKASKRHPTGADAGV